jgi:integrase
MTGTITKRLRRGGTPAWGYSFFAGRTSSGKRIQITKSGFESRKEAGQALLLAIQQHRTGPATVSRLDFGTFINRWLEEHAKHRCTPKTLERYTQLSRYALRHLGNIDLHSLTPVSIESALNALRNSGGHADELHPLGRPLSARTVRHVAFLVHDSLEAAVRWGTLPMNPMDRVVLPKPERKEPKVLDEQGLGQFLDAVRGTSLFPLLVTAVSTGCRRGELLALEWRDIDFQTGMITISKSLEQTKNGLRIKSTKSGNTRRFPLPSVALDVLMEHRRNQENGRRVEAAHRNLDLVFCDPDRDYYKPDQMSSRIAEIAKRVGYPGIGLHSMRHTHASQLLSRGVPIPTVSKRLGHANPSITLRLYAHALESDELIAAKRWNDSFADLVKSDAPSDVGH